MTNLNNIRGKTPKYYHLILRNGWKHKVYNSFKNKKVLDIGTGLGKLMKKYNFHGLDVSDYSIKINKNKKLFKIGSALDIPYENNTFDLVILNHICEHIERNNLAKAINEIKRVLKDGGQVFITGPNPLNPFYYDTPSHINPVSLRLLFHMFNANKFSLIEMGYSLFRPLPYKLQFILFLLLPHLASEYYLRIKKTPENINTNNKVE